MRNRPEVVLARMREICLALPNTKETLTWGSPHFRVGEKIFAGCGEEHGAQSIGFKLEMDHADALVMNDARFKRAAYVGHKGWVAMDPTTIADWNEVRDLVGESYRLIAPKRLVATIDSATPKKPTKKAVTTAKATTKKTTKATLKTARKTTKAPADAAAQRA